MGNVWIGTALEFDICLFMIDLQTSPGLVCYDERSLWGQGNFSHRKKWRHIPTPTTGVQFLPSLQHYPTIYYSIMNHVLYDVLCLQKDQAPVPTHLFCRKAFDSPDRFRLGALLGAFSWFPPDS